MKFSCSVVIALLVALSNPAFSETTSQQHDHADASEGILDIDAAAAVPVAVVDRFTAALSKGDLIAAGAQLDPNVLILESGGAERTAAEYLAGHAKEDAQFLRSAHQQLIHRTARANGDIAWVATESELHLQKDNKPISILSTETMLLQRREGAWKITHIHWSSRTKKPAAAN